MRSLHVTTKSSPCSPQLEKARTATKTQHSHTKINRKAKQLVGCFPWIAYSGWPGECEMIYQLIPNLPLKWKKEKNPQAIQGSMWKQVGNTLRSEEWRIGGWSVNLTPASWWFIFLIRALWSPTEDHRDGRGASAPDRVLWESRAGLCGSVLSKKSRFHHPSPFPASFPKANPPKQ